MKGPPVMDFASMDNAALSAALAEANEKAKALFALENPTVESADEAEAVVANIKAIEDEQAERSRVVKDAEDRFAAARAKFTASAEADEEDEESEEDETEDAETEEVEDVEVEAAEEPVAAATEDEKNVVEDDAEDEEPFAVASETEDGASAVTTASARGGQKINAARAVARGNKRPAVKAEPPVTITAGADIPNVATGSVLASMVDVAKATKARAKGFPQFNARQAQQVADNSGGAPVLNKFGVASFNVNFDADQIASRTDKDYSATSEAVKAHVERLEAGLQTALSGKPATMSAAGWCAPSPVVYNWIADYVVDGLKSSPEVSAPRGGLQITQGPQLAQSTYADVDNFGFGGTEAEAIAGDFNKTCETIECPGFDDFRLDYTGYCWKIPILTEHSYPELVADALRLSNVLYAHKMNRRYINDILGMSTAVSASGLGASVTDTLEALVQVATKERRWWNIGENAIMEVTLPQYVKDIFKMDMARRSGLALNDVATDQKLAAYFANHRLAIEYVADFDDRHGAAAAAPNWPGAIRAIIHPAGTFAKAVEDVINLSAVYDAASLAQNEYTGVFFEQGYMALKLGYRSHVVTIPVCTSGATGANLFACEGSL